jgi:hypothetical protein
MRKLHVFQIALVIAVAFIIDPAFYGGAFAKEKCISIGGKRVCFEDGKNKKGNAEDDDNNGDGEPQPTGNKCQGEVACPSGYVVLDKPNKYGACCEPKEGFPNTEAKKPGPGSCPAGTEFVANYGKCMFVRCQSYSPEAAGEPKERVSDWPRGFENNCTNAGGGRAAICKSRPNPTRPEWLLFDCCCYTPAPGA